MLRRVMAVTRAADDIICQIGVVDAASPDD
jgi:hypothetical protein